MKIRIETDNSITEDEIVIKCREFSDDIEKIRRSIFDCLKKVNLTFYKGDSEFYIPVNSVLFFETSENGIDAHTVDNVFQIKYKLYELLKILPDSFVRISKSGIVNVNAIYSIDRNLSSVRSISFKNTHKKIYVSRNYYKELKNKLEQIR